MIFTNDFFTAIDPEKQTRIINAAYKEFAMHGYKKASTNRIVEEAGIGKGMLFYYFNSKQELYTFLLDYAIAFIEKYFHTLTHAEYDGDYLEMYRKASRIKLEAYLENPHVFDFLTRLYLHGDDGVSSDEIKQRYREIETMRKQFFKDLDSQNDVSAFRTDIPVDKIKNYIKWALDGYSQHIINNLNIQTVLSDTDFEPYWQEFDEYLLDLKKLFYK